jgi:hypothetical protein
MHGNTSCTLCFFFFSFISIVTKSPLGYIAANMRVIKANKTLALTGILSFPNFDNATKTPQILNTLHRALKFTVLKFPGNF